MSSWNRFWFEPQGTASLALFRIMFGLICLGWALSLVPDVSAFFSTRGILPHQPPFSGQFWGAWGLLGSHPSGMAAAALLALLILASVCLVVGLATRLAALVVFIAVMSFERRNPFVFNGGDSLVRILAFYLVLAPAGAALSVDRLLGPQRRNFWAFPRRAPWAWRLMQIQLSVTYLVAVWDKVRGTTWNDGTAVSYALRIADLNRLPVPAFISSSALISNVLTYGTLALELSLAVLVWNRKLRPWVLLAGLSLHLGIEYSIRVGFFGLAIVSVYLVFVAPETSAAFVIAVRDQLTRFVARGVRRPHRPGDAPSPSPAP